MTMKKQKTLQHIAAVAVVLLTFCLVFAAPVSAGVVECSDGCAISAHVAAVGDKHYTDLQEAITDAAPSGTVEILTDVTVEKWIMFSEDLSIGDGNIITLSIDGLTINGNNNKLTINSIESAGNGNYMFRKSKNLTINDLIIKHTFNGIDSLEKGHIKNVTFDGCNVAVYPGSGEMTIEGCTFKNNAVIYHEEANQKLVVTGCTFENVNDKYVIFLRGATTFTDNTIVNGKVNVVSGSPTVTGNIFGDKATLEIYSGDATATISGNTITNLVFEEGVTEVKSTFTDNILSDEAKKLLSSFGLYEIKYDISVTPAKVGFDSVKVGYTQPEAQTVTIKNAGNVLVTIKEPTYENFDVIDFPANAEIAEGKELTFKIQPKAGLSVGNYGTTLEVTNTDNGKATFEVSFLVYQPSSGSSSKPVEEPVEPEVPVEPETPTDEPVAGEVTVETEVTDGGEVELETPAAEGEGGSAAADEDEAKITGVVLPTGTDSEVTFVPVSEQAAPAGQEENTKKVFEINVPSYEKGKAAVIKFTMTVAELAADGKEAADVALWHFDEETGEWTKLVTSYTIVDGIVYFEAITNDFSPFAIVYEDEPVDEPVDEPETPASPAPVLGLIAALGAAVALRRK